MCSLGHRRHFHDESYRRDFIYRVLLIAHPRIQQPWAPVHQLSSISNKQVLLVKKYQLYGDLPKSRRDENESSKVRHCENARFQKQPRERGLYHLNRENEYINGVELFH